MRHTVADVIAMEPVHSSVALNPRRPGFEEDGEARRDSVRNSVQDILTLDRYANTREGPVPFGQHANPTRTSDSYLTSEVTIPSPY